MNVLCYVQPHRGGGVARHSVEMINGLSRHSGICCTLFGSGPDFRQHPAFLPRFPGMPVCEHPFPGKWIERSWKLLRRPSVARRCRGHDVVYSPAEVLLPRCGIPSIVTVHDVQALEEDLPWSGSTSHQAFRRKWLRWLPKLFAEATRVATVSEFSRQRMVTLLGVDARRILVIGNGVSSAFFRSEALDSPSPEPTIIVIGGLRLKKGAAETLAVAKALQRRGSDLKIDIYGQHDHDWAARASQHANVRLHGWLDDEALARRLQESTALLFLSPYEGFGIPAVEAMAAGTPAVVANAASLPEVVGDAGIVVDQSDAESVAEILVNLSADVMFRTRQVAAGRRHAGQFTWAACADRLAAAIQSVVS